MLSGGTHRANLVVRSLFGNGLAQGSGIGEARLLGNFIVQLGQNFTADLVQLAFDGDGLAAQFLHRENVRADHGSLALFSGVQGTNERIKFAHLFPFPGRVNLHQIIFGLHAVHILALKLAVNVDQNHICILRQTIFRHIFQMRHGTEHPAGDFIQLGGQHFGVFHVNFQSGKIFRQLDVVGQHFKAESKGEILAARSLGAFPLKLDAGHGVQLFLVQNLRNGFVHQRVGGPGVNLVAKALFQHLGGHLALAETGQDQIGAETAYCLVNGAIHIRSRHGNRNFALDGRNCFYAVFHNWDNSFIHPRTTTPRKVF